MPFRMGLLLVASPSSRPARSACLSPRGTRRHPAAGRDGGGAGVGELALLRLLRVLRTFAYLVVGGALWVVTSASESTHP
jgi:hypothetical protein